MRHVIVCGGRSYARKSVVKRILAGLLLPGDVIVHGGATGADSLASNWAARQGYKSICFPANWEVHGKAAGPIRNSQMLTETSPDLVIAFPGGAGTADMISRAKASGVKVVQVSKYEGDA